VVLFYPDTGHAEPLLTFFDRNTNRQEVVVSDVLIKDTNRHMILIRFDRLSNPGIDDLTRTVFTISLPTPIPASTDLGQPGLLVAAVMSTTTTQPGEGGGPGSPGQSGSGGPGSLSGQGSAAAAPGSINGGGNDPFLVSMDRWDTGPLRDLPPAPDSLIGLPPVAIVPSQVMPPTAPPTRREDRREEAPPDDQVPAIPQEPAPAEPADPQDPAVWDEEVASDLVFAEAGAAIESEDQQDGMWLAAMALLYGRGDWSPLAPDTRSRSRARLRSQGPLSSS
jgi:hypothetical protein